MSEIAEIVRRGVGEQVEINAVPTDDHRSYHISSEKIRRELGYEPAYSLGDAVSGLTSAFRSGTVPDPSNNDRYYNIKTMQNINLM